MCGNGLKQPEYGIRLLHYGFIDSRPFLCDFQMITYSTTPEDIDKKWILIDADGLVLGRLAAFVATRLRGKHLAKFSPHMDTGDNVIIINAGKVELTGNKLKDKMHYWHTGYPGGIKSRTSGQILKGKFPEKVVSKAIQRMLPTNKLSRKLMTNLRVYAGSEHPHEAQNPEIIDLGSMNRKNTRSKV